MQAIRVQGALLLTLRLVFALASKQHRVRATAWLLFNVQKDAPLVGSPAKLQPLVVTSLMTSFD